MTHDTADSHGSLILRPWLDQRRWLFCLRTMITMAKNGMGPSNLWPLWWEKHGKMMINDGISRARSILILIRWLDPPSSTQKWIAGKSTIYRYIFIYFFPSFNLHLDFSTATIKSSGTSASDRLWSTNIPKHSAKVSRAWRWQLWQLWSNIQCLRMSAELGLIIFEFKGIDGLFLLRIQEMDRNGGFLK